MRYVGTLHKEIGTDFTQKTQTFKCTPSSAGFHRPILPLHPAGMRAIIDALKSCAFLGTLRDAWHSENVR